MKGSTNRGAIVAAVIAIAGVGATGGDAAAQDSEIVRQIESLAQDNAPLYLNPIARGLGASLNRGTFFSASPLSPLGFEVGLAAVGAFVPRFDETFTPILPAEVTFEGQTYQDPYGTSAPETPTVAGIGDGVVIQPGPELSAAAVAAGQSPSDLALPFPQGLDIPVVPFAVAQISVGLPGGTEVSVRGFPSVEIHEDVGSVQALGLGVTHSLSQYLPLPVLQISAHASWQSVDVGDYLDADALAYGVLAGVDAGPVSVFGAAVREDPDVTIGYTVANPQGNPALPRDGLRVIASPDIPATTRYTAGTTVNLLALKLSAAWTFGTYETLALKALIAIG